MIKTEQYNKIIANIEATKFTDLKLELYKYAVKYARIRVDWYFAYEEKRREMDISRTLAHNAFIDSCNILSRNMAAIGEDNIWRTILGNDRRDIGDFGCYLQFYIGIQAK